MMNKFLEFARRGEPLNIKSVVASNSKGFIYVEAEREPHAKDALNGLRDVQQYTMKLVPIHEMTSVLHVQKMRKPLTVGAWTRMKRAGLYKGDLCKVLEILDNGARVSCSWCSVSCLKQQAAVLTVELRNSFHRRW